MTINDLVKMAQRIHDAEGYDLGPNSSREYRNAFWARVIGCAHHGHPAYNPTPDPAWNLKKAGPSSPQSDDVAAQLPSREAWDCIPGAGAAGYRFEAHHIGALPPVQVIYAPSVPDGSGAVPKPKPKPEPPAQPTYPPYPGDGAFNELGAVLFGDYAAAGQGPNSQMGQWFGRATYDWLVKNEPTLAASIAKHRKEWRSLLGLPPL